MGTFRFAPKERQAFSILSTAGLLLLASCTSELSGGDDEGNESIDADEDRVLDELGKRIDESFDIDQDGVPDGVGVDTDEDGVSDAVGFDTDDDGIIDSLDLDGDGLIDVGGALGDPRSIGGASGTGGMGTGGVSNDGNTGGGSTVTGSGGAATGGSFGDGGTTGSGGIDGSGGTFPGSGGMDGTGGEVSDAPYCEPTMDWDPGWAALEQEILDIVNQRRAEGANCGGETMPPAPPLSMDPALQCAARMHSLDMAERDYFSHDNPEGESPFDRMAEAGYEGRGGGENIAAGNETAAATMDQWMNSSGHCRNLMNDSFTLIGVGYYPGGDYGHLWTQTFGAD